MTTTDHCPACGESLVPVFVGFQGADEVEAEEWQGVVLAGCVVNEEEPALACPWQGDGHL